MTSRIHKLALVSCHRRTGQVQPVVDWLKGQVSSDDTLVCSGIMDDENPGVVRIIAQELGAYRREMLTLQVGFRGADVQSIAQTIRSLVRSRQDTVVLLDEEALHIVEEVTRLLVPSELQRSMNTNSPACVLFTLINWEFSSVSYFPEE